MKKDKIPTFAALGIKINPEIKFAGNEMLDSIGKGRPPNLSDLLDMPMVSGVSEGKSDVRGYIMRKLLSNASIGTKHQFLNDEEFMISLESDLDDRERFRKLLEEQCSPTDITDRVYAAGPIGRLRAKRARKAEMKKTPGSSLPRTVGPLLMPRNVGKTVARNLHEDHMHRLGFDILYDKFGNEARSVKMVPEYEFTDRVRYATPGRYYWAAHDEKEDTRAWPYRIGPYLDKRSAIHPYEFTFEVFLGLFNQIMNKPVPSSIRMASMLFDPKQLSIKIRNARLVAYSTRRTFDERMGIARYPMRHKPVTTLKVPNASLSGRQCGPWDWDIAQAVKRLFK